MDKNEEQLMDKVKKMMKIRKAVSSDVGRVYELGRDLKASKVNMKTITFWPKKTLSKIVQSKEDVFLVAEKDKKIIGYIIVNYSSSFGKAVVENIFVDESRNQGIGTALLEEAINILKRKGCKYICAFTKVREGKTIRWLERRGIKGSERFLWSDRILSKDFLNEVKDGAN